MHRISIFGDVASAESVTYSHMIMCKLGEGYQHMITPTPFTVKYVRGAKGPRFETQEKGNTISGFPGGPVHSVNHLYLDGACIPTSSSGYESMATFSTDLIVPIANVQWNSIQTPDQYPSLARGECKGIVLEVSLKKDAYPWNYPYGVRTNIQYVARTSYPYFDQVVSWSSYFDLETTVDGDGDYLVLSSGPTITGGVDGYKTWINSPVYLPSPYVLDDVDLIRTMSSQSDSSRGSDFVTLPPFLDDVKHYWEKEKVALRECSLEKDKLRDCSLEALEHVTFTDALTFENMKDLLELAKTFRGIARIPGTLRSAIKTMNPMKLLSVIASVHLIYRYVFKTSLRDLNDLWHLSQQIWEHRDIWWDYLSMSRGRCKPLEYQKTVTNQRVYDCIMNLRLDLRPAQFHFMEYLRAVGFAPRLEGFWDLIPYSFVVDWVLSIGDTIKAWAAIQDMDRLDKLFVASLKSYRQINEMIRPGILFRGKSQRFLRIVSRNYLGSTDLKSLTIKNPIKNFWTGVALVIRSITRP